MPLYPNLDMKSNKSQDRQLFFGINRYIKRANQKIVKNKNHERKALKKSQKQKANTKEKKKKVNKYITEKKNIKIEEADTPCLKP